MSPAVSCFLSRTSLKRRSERRFQLQMFEPVHRLDLDSAHLVVLQHIERNGGASAPLCPDLAIEVGQVFGLLAIDADDHVAALDARPLRRARRVMRLTKSRPPISSVLIPSHGRAGPGVRPAAIRSARIDERRSIGTNMFPGALLLPPPALPTRSERTPTSLPSRLISAAPLQAGWGGAVKIASSSRYSQLPANSRLATTCTGATMPAPP